jgi:hypothetical protein
MLKPWWQVVTPHRDIREGKLSDFAADLRRILKGEATIEYLDPNIFFKRTHLTKGLRNIIEDVLLSLSGKEESKILQIQTPFGGGKTHALVSLYHLVKNKTSTDDIKAFLEENGLEIPKTNVATFVGTVPDPLKGKTPWGEIAEQLGVYELVKEHDLKRITPGREILEGILDKCKPLLILIDEIAEYVVKAKEFEDQVLAFCQELTEAVRSSKQCVLVCTLPSSTPYGERGEKVLNQLQRIFGRMQVIYTPVEGEEIYEILRKRLFEDLGDKRVHELVANEYFSLYQRLGEEVPYEAREIRYKERIQKAYPFHPEVIDILFERWGTIPTFQRTRGVLRLLAEVVSDLYRRQDPSPLIQPSSLNLANPRIRRMFIEHIGEVFESVLASDIVGDGAKAVAIDELMGTEYARFNVATGLATSIFFYSFSSGKRNGVSAQRLRLAFLREEIPPAIVGDALRRLEDELWYLHFEKNLYYFSSKVSLNRVIIDKEEAIGDEIEAEMRRRIEKTAGKDFDVFVWTTSNSDIPDNKKLKLIILPFDFMIDNAQTMEVIKDILDKHSTSFRAYKNTLMFLIADPSEYDGFKGIIRRFLALNSIKDDDEIMKTLTEEDEKRINQRLKDADSSAWFKIISVYRHLAKAFRDEVKISDLGIPTLGERPTLTGRVKDFLKDQELLLDKISPKALIERTFSKEDERKSVDEIWEAFLKYPELPILENERVLRNAIVQGVKDGTFGLLIDDKIYYMETISPEEVLEEAQIVGKKIAQKIKEQVEEVKVPTIAEEKPPIEVPPPKPIVEERVVRKMAMRVQIPWDKLSDLVRGVFIPLSHEGAQISLEIKIDAESEKGIGKDTLELKIKETLEQIGAKVVEEKIE